MAARIIAFAVPVFFLLIGLEVLWGRLRGKRWYRLQDSIANLSCGVGQQLLAVVWRTFVAVVYLAVYDHWRVFDVPVGAVWGWVVLLLLADLCYYWFHRAGHRVNAVWAAHAVHHQSEEFNLSVALRQSWFVALINWVFYLPCAVAGFPPEMFIAVNSGITLYQFWIHNEAVRSLGPLEWVLNTPSHHRVHHGTNPKYIDKNYGGTFIVWDRLFGTFVKEDEEVVYGTVKPLSSWNPLWAQLEVWVGMARLARRCTRPLDKLKVLFAPPEWRPAELGGDVVIPEVSRASQTKYDPSAPLGLGLYVVLQFALVVTATTGFMLVSASLSTLELAAFLAWGVASLQAFGALFEAKRWALPLEGLRLLCAGAGILWWSSAPAAWGLLALIPASAVWLWTQRAHFRAGQSETISSSNSLAASAPSLGLTT